MLQRCVTALAWMLCAGLCLPAQLRAETPVFRSLGAADGLPSERVYSLAQDHEGLLWLATADGLARYDGSRIDVFRHEPGNPHSLPANVTQVVHVDGRGRVFVGTEGRGLAWWQPDRGFQRWQGSDGMSADIDVWAISSDAEHHIWFGGFGVGLYRLDPGLQRAEHWQTGDGSGLPSNIVLSLAADADGAIWIGTERGLVHGRNGVFKLIGEADGLPSATVFRVSLDGDQLWVAGVQGVYRRVGQRFEPVAGLSPGQAMAVLDDHAGSLWVGRQRGVERFSQGRSELLIGQPRLRYAPGNQAIMDLLRDHEGGLWMASNGNGVQHLPPRWQRFRTWLAGEGGMQAAVPSAIAFDGAGGLLSAGPEGRIDRIAADGSVAPQRLLDPWPYGPVTGLWVDPQRRVWIGHRNGLLKLEPGATRAQDWPADGSTDAPARGLIDLFAAAPDGGFWLSINGVAIEHRAADGRLLRRYTADQGLGPADSEQLRVDAQGQLWVAGDQGLRRLDADGEQFELLPEFEGERVFGFVFAGADGLWLSRRSGLEQYRRAHGRWQRVAIPTLLAGVEVSGLSLDRNGMLWAGSTRGLWRIDPGRARARVYGVRDGLPGQEFSSRPLAEQGNGEFAALLPEAVLRIDPTLFRDDEAPPQVRAEPPRWQRQGQTLSLAVGESLQLRHDDREIRLGARVVSFSDPRQWRYRARLSPFDADWVELGAQGNRVFSALPPGRYRWEIAAAGGDERWHSLPEQWIDVHPPWWQTGAARTLAAVLALAALALGYRLLRVRAERRAAAALADSQRRWALQASEQKSRFLATLAHEIRTPMTGLLGMAELMAREPLDAAQAQRLAAMRRSGELLLRLVNDALDMARIEAGEFSLRSAVFAPRQLLVECGAAVEGVAVLRGLQIHSEVAAEVPDWVRGDPQRLQQILLNLLGNALKFTEHGEVRLRLSVDATQRLRFEVVDSGPGMSEEEQSRLFRRFAQAQGEDTARRYGGSGLGLAISRELAAVMGGELDLRSTPGEGTVVALSLSLPVADPPVGSEAVVSPVSEPGGALLLVEDDPDVAAAIGGQLQAAGFRVSHAAHALAALSALGSEEFHAAVLDLDLPGVSGLELAGLLHAQRPGLRLLALTARSDPAAEDEARAAGFAAFLRKPASIEQLSRALQAGEPD